MKEARKHAGTIRPEEYPAQRRREGALRRSAKSAGAVWTAGNQASTTKLWSSRRARSWCSGPAHNDGGFITSASKGCAPGRLYRRSEHRARRNSGVRTERAECSLIGKGGNDGKYRAASQPSQDERCRLSPRR